MTVVEQSSPAQPVETKMVCLGDIAKFINGAAFKPTDWNDEGARIIRIQNLNDPKKPYNRTTRIVGPQFHVSPGDLLVSWSASLGVFVWDQPDVGLLNQHIFRVIPDHGLVTDDYLRHMLVGALADMEAHLHGATMKHVNRKEFLAVRIPHPPLSEQRRIAAVLDKADHLRTQRREALAHLDALTQSIFDDMFGSPSKLADRWNEIPLADVALQITDGEHQTPIRTTAGIKLLSARNVQNGALDFRSVDFIGTDEYARISKRCKPTRGDILISCSGTIGRVSVIDTDEAFSLVRSVALVRPNPDLILPKFLEGQLLAPSLQAQMQRGSRSSGQANLFQAPIRRLRIILPPLELQQIFARRVAGVERLREQHRTQLAQLDTLFTSLQHRAFSGQL